MKEKRNTTPSSIRGISAWMRYIFIAMAAAASLSGIVLRSVELANHNYVFVYDQGLDMMAARSIAVGHKLTLIGAEAGGGFAGLPGIFHGPGYHYLLAAISIFSRGDPYGAMAVLWVMHMGEIWFLYVLGKRLFGRWGGVGAAFMTAVSPVFIGMTRVIWAPNFAGLCIVLYLFALFTSRPARTRSMMVLGFMASVLYNFEIPLAVAAVLSAIGYMWLVQKIRRPLYWAAFISGCVAGFLPMIAFDARHGWTTVRGIIGFFTHPVILSTSVPYDIAGHIRAILFYINGIFPSISGLPYWFWTALLVLGVWVYRRRDTRIQRYPGVTALGIIAVVHILLFVPYRNPVYGHYLTILSYAVVLTVGYIVARMHEERYDWMIGIILLAVAIPALLLYPRTAYADYRDYGGTAKIKGKTDAIDAVYRLAGGKPFNLLIFTPPVYTYPYEYLLQWYAKDRYGYTPGQKKQGTVFLLIEPDPEKPWSYNGWLETVIQTGTVESTVTLPSGFIIQKRFMKL